MSCADSRAWYGKMDGEKSMTKFKMCVAGRCIGVQTLFENTKEYCAEYLCDGAPAFCVATSQADIDFERQKSIREAEIEGLPVRQYSNEYLETLALQRKITEELFRYDTLLFHGSVVAVDGEAFLFTAKSGTGKSTHTRLWREVFGERAVMVNDDKPFLTITEEGVFAYGSPWNGKHHLGANTSVPLKAICILERGEENEIHPISPKDALFMLFQQSNRPRNARNLAQYMNLLDRLSVGVAFYSLSCNMSPEAAMVAYEAMRRK